MGKKKGNFFMGLLALALVLGLLSGPVLAESNTVVGNSATARLNFAINIPTILSLQVGTPGALVDTVACTLGNIPGSGGVVMSSTGTNPVPVRVAAIVGAATIVTLSVNSSTPLAAGGNTIPFNQITCAGGGAFSGYTFNTGAAQVLDTFTGPGNRTGDYTFTYANANYYPTGNYTGQVTYTLASP